MELRGVLVCLGFAIFSQAMQYKRVCYYTNWSQYKPSPMKFFPESIDPRLCSHVIYAFATLRGNRLHSYEWNDESTEWNKGMYERMSDLKLKWPHLKTLIAVGGWNIGTAKMTAMLATKENREEFVMTSVDYLKKHKFDGLALEFQYPGSHGSPPEDKHRFTLLCQELQAEFKKHGFLLTAAVPVRSETIDAGYEIPAITQELDFINLGFDFSNPWNNYTAHHAPLYPREAELVDGEKKKLNIKWAADRWLKEMGEENRHKLVIGLTMHGRSLTLKDEEKHGYDAPVKGPGPCGAFTRERGTCSYYTVCKSIQSGWTIVQDKESMVPYAYGHVDTTPVWVSYDDIASLRNKVDYIKHEKFGGFMVWSLDLDDFNGKNCKQGNYPLLSAVNDQLGVDFPTAKPLPQTTPPRPTDAPTGPTPTPGPTPPPTPKPTLYPPGKDCGSRCKHLGKNGFFKHPVSETRYCQCYNQGASFVEGTCAPGTVWCQQTENTGNCIWPNEICPEIY